MIAEKEHCIVLFVWKHWLFLVIIIVITFRGLVCVLVVLLLYTWWAQPKSTPGFNEGFPYHAQKSQQSLFWVINDLKNKSIGF